MTTVLDTPDSIRAWQGISLKLGIRMYLRSGMTLRRSYTPANMRASATVFTGKTYARSRKGLEQALADMTEIYPDSEK